MDQYELGKEVGLRPGMQMGTQLPLPQSGTAPNFWPMSAVAKRLNGSKMTLSREVGLSPGDIFLDGTQPPPPKKGHSSPHFSAHVYCGQTI